jgi:hypothetical protein
MTLETLQKAWHAPAVFVFGNDASAKQAFALWREQAARREGCQQSMEEESMRWEQ